MSPLSRREHAEAVIAALSEALPHSLEHDGCEAIHLRRSQDDLSHVVSFTQWTRRQDYENYLAWRTETGMTDEPAVIDHQDLSTFGSQTHGLA